MSIYKPGRPSKYDPFTGKGSPPPSAPGEYRIRDAAGSIAYVGETNDLRRRTAPSAARAASRRGRRSKPGKRRALYCIEGTGKAPVRTGLCGQGLFCVFRRCRMFQGGVVPFYKKFLADISFRPLMFQGGVVLQDSAWGCFKGFRPPVFQGGVVPFEDSSDHKPCFRPLMFQGGVVLNGLGQKPGKGFRPLLFQGGVVLGTIITPVNGEF